MAKRFKIPTKRTGLRRLRKLADFLDKIPRSHFDFSVIRGRVKPTRSNRCGTTGCAIGWTAEVFPRLIGLGVDDDYPSILKQGSCRRVAGSVTDIAKNLFAMPYEDSYQLFFPDRSHEACTPRSLPQDATPKQVAKRLRQFADSQ